DVNVTIHGLGNVTRQPNSPQAYYLSNVVMQGSPGPGFILDSWGGDIVGAGTPLGAYNPILFRADSNRTVVCPCVGPPPPVINLTIVGHGVVNKNPDQPNYPPSSTVILTAVPDSGWRFVGWSGEFVTSSNPLAAFMDHDKNLTATF